MAEEHQRPTTRRLKKAVKMSVYMKLLVVISLMLTLSHVGVNSARVRRFTHGTITDKEKTEILQTHNRLRSQEGSADMEMLTWSDSVARRATDWVAQCTRDTGTILPPTSGQNQIMVFSGKINLTGTIQEWFDEKANYVYDTGCKDKGMCKNYTQVVWATSRQVGCAYQICKSGSKSGQFLACHYEPAGNVQNVKDQKPYKKGPACSQCDSGAGWCKGRLCNSQCTKEGKDCVCMAICHNCATLNRTTCRCSCADGWFGADCSERCEEKSDDCDPKFFNLVPSKVLCEHNEYGSSLKRSCPVMCNLCKPKPDAKANECDPVYAPAAKQMEMFVTPAASNYSDSDNRSQHQQQCTTVALLSNVILSLTITWKALL